MARREKIPCTPCKMGRALNLGEFERASKLGKFERVPKLGKFELAPKFGSSPFFIFYFSDFLGFLDFFWGFGLFWGFWVWALILLV